MVSTKLVDNNIPDIEAKLLRVGGDMVKIEYLENCLKQLLQNNVRRFCHVKLAELYEVRLMLIPAAKNYALAIETVTSSKEQIAFCIKEIRLLIKAGDYLGIDRPFKKALTVASSVEKEAIKQEVKQLFYNQAKEYELKQNNRKAVDIYERIMELSFVKDDERKQIMQKLGQLNSKLGRIKQAMDYEKMKDKPITRRKNLDDDSDGVRRVSFEDLGIDWD